MSFILIVEDDPDIREDLTEVLREEGFRVESAASGEQALQRLLQTPDCGLVLLDLMMPGMTGWDFRRRQRSFPSLAKVPVVLITGADDLRRRTRELDAAGALQKPFSIPELVETVSTYVARVA